MTIVIILLATLLAFPVLLLVIAVLCGIGDGLARRGVHFPDVVTMMDVVAGWIARKVAGR